MFVSAELEAWVNIDEDGVHCDKECVFNVEGLFIEGRPGCILFERSTPEYRRCCDCRKAVKNTKQDAELIYWHTAIRGITTKLANIGREEDISPK